MIVCAALISPTVPTPRPLASSDLRSRSSIIRATHTCCAATTSARTRRLPPLVARIRTINTSKIIFGFLKKATARVSPSSRPPEPAPPLADGVVAEIAGGYANILRQLGLIGDRYVGLTGTPAKQLAV